MNETTFLAAAALIHVLGFILFKGWIGVREDFKVVIRPSGEIAAVFIALLSFLAYPLVSLHRYLIRRENKRGIALWSAAWLVLLFFFLFLKPNTLLLVLACAYRLADIARIHAYVTFAELPPGPARRALSLLLVHYLEVFVIFAYAYVWISQETVAFQIHGCNRSLTQLEGLYFSFVSGATIGYGDISPSHMLPFSHPRPALIVILQSLTLTFLTLVEFPRIFAHWKDPKYGHHRNRGGHGLL
ncbi:MAG: hypothetical protein JST93_01035 [Acidobacteria bacterium]|nr:hypothetical protein [Acidobacteriota bacterium]